MKNIVKSIALSAVVSSLVVAGGYKIPEQSLNSMALGAAYVANTSGADTAYFNPANMAFMEDKQYVAGALTLAHLPSNTYTLGGPYSGESEVENLPIPSFHYVANAMGDFRWGVSMVAPGGLTKRWETPFQKASAEEFTLKVVELNPSMSYKLADNLAIGAGLRLVYSEGIVKSDSADTGGALVASREMEGDSLALGYNLALAYKPTSTIHVAVTYRSNVDLEEEGEAKLFVNAINPKAPFYNGDASVTVPLPAALNIAIAKQVNDKLTLEFNYERTFWSEYKNLDFEYSTALPAFDAPIARNWEDTNTFRVGATLEVDEKLTVMMGVAIDETPAPVENIGFELPDSDAKIFSMGFRYQQTPQLSWGAALLYTAKDTITLKRGAHEDQSATNVLNQGGRFSDGGAILTTVGLAYEF
ncbi:MAG: outer membrane protein transport protein [Campylobacterota bacterium]|nr:outer membrane protein transport protein [Campylobacterota bacterium]